MNDEDLANLENQLSYFFNNYKLPISVDDIVCFETYKKMYYKKYLKVLYYKKRKKGYKQFVTKKGKK